MNTKALSRNYQTLTPRERLPLIMAAAARGDEVELQRLAQSAPKESYRVPDYFGLAHSFRETLVLHFMELLEAAACFLECLALAEAWIEDEQGERMHKTALCFGYVFRAKREGWGRFCRELNLNPDQCIPCFPGYHLLERAEEYARVAVPSKEEVLKYLKEAEKGPAELISADLVAADLHQCLKWSAEFWE